MLIVKQLTTIYIIMKYSDILHMTHVKLLAGCLLTAGMACSCVEEDVFDAQKQLLPDHEAMAVRPSAWGMQTQTRVDYYDDTSGWQEDVTKIDPDADLKEGDLGTKLDVFIAGKTDPTFWRQYHLTQGEVFAGSTAKVLDNTLDVLARGNWLAEQGIKPGDRYDVYVAVNNTSTNSDVASREALLGLTFQNPDVDKIYKAPAVNPESAVAEDRRLLMDGHAEWTPNADLQQTIPVGLSRAAAKIAVSVSFDPAFLKAKEAEGIEITTPAWRYANWCDSVRVFADGTPLSLDDLTLKISSDRSQVTHERTGAEAVTSTDYYYYTTEENGESTTHYVSSRNIIEENGKTYYDEHDGTETIRREVTQGTEAVDVKACDILTYIYPFAWNDDNLGSAPHILVSYGFKKGSTTHNYYYRIPLVNEAETNALLRNHIYKVNAVIGSEGSASITEDFSDLVLNYEVVEWTERENQRLMVRGDRLYYFLLEPTLYNVYGQATQTQVISYVCHSDAEVKLSDITWYYYNNSGKQERTLTPSANGLSAGNLATDGVRIELNPATKQITVTTDVLKNHAVKFIKFRAYASDRADWLTQNYYADVTVKHFPIDNIQSISGKWSSRSIADWTDYEKKTGAVYRDYSYWNGYGYGYNAKFSPGENEQIRYLGAYGNTSGTQAVNGLTNNHMYVIQITATSENYVLGRPTLDARFQSKDHVVSPAFMIASQLGAVVSQAFNATTAAEHCGTYMEVATDGTRYTGWRLPTNEEIKVITTYQYDSDVIHDGTMAEVLSGRRYYTLNGTNELANPNGNAGTFVRCIRDLSADEVEELNSKAE